MKHFWSNQRHFIFMGMKKALKRNLHVVKPSCRSTESYHISSFPSLRKFTDKLPSLWRLLDHKLPKMGRKLEQSLEVLILVLWSTQKPDITAWWHRKNGCLLSYMNSYHDSHIMSKHLQNIWWLASGCLLIINFFRCHHAIIPVFGLVTKTSVILRPLSARFVR